MGHLNNIPIAYMIKSDADFQYQPLTPSHFLMGAAYNKLQPKDGNARLLSKGRPIAKWTKWLRMCVCS
jgi:hypothetical protein